jgi:hypothetical protein
LGKRFQAETAEQFVAALSSGSPAQSKSLLAIESLAWCHALPRLTGQLPASLWWDLLRQLLSSADESAREVHPDPLCWQLWSAELPMTLAYLFPELTPCRQRAHGGLQSLRDGMEEILDGEGLPHSKDLHLLRPLLACWTRWGYLAEADAELAWDKSARAHFAWTVQQALRFTRRDHTQVFSNQPAEAFVSTLFKAAIKLADNRACKRLARVTLDAKKNRDGAIRKKKLPAPCLNSHWSALTVLRPSWQSTSPQLAVSYSGRQVQVELTTGRELLASGVWQCDVAREGQACQMLTDWDEVCWQSDEDVDYLELEAKFSGDITIQRHIVMARKDGFLMLADAVIGQQTGTLAYRGTLPLAAAVRFDPAADSRDGRLVGRKQRARLMPLALKEWRSDHRPGGLEQTSEGLVLNQTQTGCSMFAPLFFDLDRNRRKEEFTWRQLTVAEQRTNLPSDVAVGYRVQCGNRQWLIYRSLSRPAMRTVLGQNLSSELLVTRFYQTGETASLVEIET